MVTWLKRILLIWIKLLNEKSENWIKLSEYFSNSVNLFDSVICTFRNPMLTIDTSKRKIHFRLIYDLISQHIDHVESDIHISLKNWPNSLKFLWIFSELTMQSLKRKSLSTSSTHFRKYKSCFLEKTSRVTRWQYGPGINRE